MTQLDKIEMDVTEIKHLLILIIPKARLPRKDNTATLKLDKLNETDRNRALALLNLFELTCKLRPEQKLDQRFPAGTFSEAHEKVEIVPRALLINRAVLRSIFKFDHRLGDKSTMDNVLKALETLKENKLVVEMPLDETELETTSRVICIFSPRWADRATGRVVTAEPVVKARSEASAKHSGSYWTPEKVVDSDLSNPDQEDEPFEGFTAKKVIKL